MVRKLFKTLVSPGPKYSLSYALFCIFLSTLIFIPITHWLLFSETVALPTTKALPIKNLFLISSTPYRIPDVIFSETLQLSADQPTYMHQFITKQAEVTLKQLGVFSSVSIEKTPDNKGIIIFYSLHEPIGYLGNQTNTLINTSGEKFPCQPFFKSQKLPNIFFSSSDLSLPNLPSWKIDLISQLMKNLKKDPPVIIDLSQTDTYPMEMIITLSSGSLLRFHYRTLEHGLKHYHMAQNHNLISPECNYIYDLRFPNHLLISKL